MTSGVKERDRRAVARGRLGKLWLVGALGLLLASFQAVGPAARGAEDAAATAYTPEEEANLEVARRFFEELHDQGNLDVAKEIVAPDAVFHIPGGELTGPEGIGGLVTLLRTAFPDAQFPMEEVITDGDHVAVRWTMRGTSKADFQGIPPTGEEVTLPGQAFLTIEDGTIVEDWVTYDQLGLLQQLDAAPGPEAS